MHGILSSSTTNTVTVISPKIPATSSTTLQEDSDSEKTYAEELGFRQPFRRDYASASFPIFSEGRYTDF